VPSWRIREATAADHAAILTSIPEILSETEAQKAAGFSPAAWRWQYVEGEHAPIIILADDGGKICGYYHAVLFTMRYRGRRAIASMEQDVATLKAYRGQGVFAAMTAFLDERKRERGVDFVYAFPNARSLHQVITYHGYVLVAHVPVYVRPLDLPAVAATRLGAAGRVLGAAASPFYRALFARAMPLARGEEVVRVDAFDAELEQLARDFGAVVPIGLERTARYLTWRFIDKPTREYAIWVLRRDARVVAHVVTRPAPLFGVRCVMLMDFGCRSGEEDALLRLISARLAAERAEGAALGVTMGLHPFFARLRRIGFVQVPERFNPRHFTFTVRAIAPDVGPDLNAPESWHLTLADWDVM